jgi:nicotinamide mononucleotide adenylyltransferase
MNQEPLADTGVIHGRFQVLHNDHLKYLLAGKALCRHLVVGITNPDPLLTRRDDTDPGRSDPADNPLTFYERLILVRDGLVEAGVPLEEFTVVPLPINLPELYGQYVPLDAVFFLTIYDDWGRRKRSLFQSLGLKTHVLWEVTPDRKGISGSEIRRRMAAGEPWQHLVPPAVAAHLRNWELPARIRQVQGEEFLKPNVNP